jgi:hypothetical protein
MSTIEVRMQELRDCARRYASAQADRVYLEQYRKSKKALLMRAAEQEGHRTSAQQEREAYAHDEYIALLQGLKVATETAERCRWELEIARMGAELWRTQSANQRAEKRGYGA